MGEVDMLRAAEALEAESEVGEEDVAAEDEDGSHYFPTFFLSFLCIGPLFCDVGPSRRAFAATVPVPHSAADAHTALQAFFCPSTCPHSTLCRTLPWRRQPWPHSRARPGDSDPTTQVQATPGQRHLASLSSCHRLSWLVLLGENALKLVEPHCIHWEHQCSIPAGAP